MKNKKKQPSQKVKNDMAPDTMRKITGDIMKLVIKKLPKTIAKKVKK